jgi:hypothetical protein
MTRYRLMIFNVHRLPFSASFSRRWYAWCALYSIFLQIDQIRYATEFVYPTPVSPSGSSATRTLLRCCLTEQQMGVFAT